MSLPSGRVREQVSVAEKTPKAPNPVSSPTQGWVPKAGRGAEKDLGEAAGAMERILRSLYSPG